MAKKIADNELRGLALVGARARLTALQGELASLLATFPELRGGRASGADRPLRQAQEARTQASDVGCGEEGCVGAHEKVLGGQAGGEEIVLGDWCGVHISAQS